MPTRPDTEDVPTDDTPAEEAAAGVKGTNELRAKAGLPPLTPEQIARIYARHRAEA